MRIALIADLHANIHALEAVAEVIALHSVDTIVCLGDLVGYHAHPVEVVQLTQVMSTVVIAGNHDREVCVPPAENRGGTHGSARIALEWTRATLGTSELDYLDGLPSRIIHRGVWVAVHGCYLNEVHVTGYVTETMLEENLQVIASSPELPKLAFCGHTHLPLVGVLEADTARASRLDAPFRWSSAARAILVNPGSVGQPRDGDVRASFAIVDTDARTIMPMRVEYDVEAAARAVERAGLPPIFATRLREGR